MSSERRPADLPPTRSLRVEQIAPRPPRAQRFWFTRILLSLLPLLIAAGHAQGADTPAAAGPLDLEPESVRPGLAAVWHSLVDPAIRVHRIDAKPAFSLGFSSPHPRLPAGPFEVTWSGVLQIQEASPLAFHAIVGGELSVEVDGVTVLSGRGSSSTSTLGSASPLTRPLGQYQLKIHYRALADIPARLQIYWEGPTFGRELVPAWRLSHIPAELPAEVAGEDKVARGREVIGRLGCARCHESALPGVKLPPPGPSLADAGTRLSRNWILSWLEDPSKVRADARMPGLFSNDRAGLTERWLIAEYLVGTSSRPGGDPAGSGDHRKGRLTFRSMGCATCHVVPDIPRHEQEDLGRFPLQGLSDRLGADGLAGFLGNPRARYPDGRMPRLPVAPDSARDIAAYLLLWSKPTPEVPVAKPPTDDEIKAALRRARAMTPAAAATTLVKEKGCASCHPGLGASSPIDVALKPNEAHGCLSGKGVPHYQLDAPNREAINAYLSVAARETHGSAVFARQQQLDRAGCVRCHQRDSDRSPLIEVVGSGLGTASLPQLPFQRTPRLTNPLQKFSRTYLTTALREGVSGLRPADYTYRMPSFGTDAEALVQALAESDGELVDGADQAPGQVADPTVGTLVGPELVGPQGYSCVSCHVWNGQQLNQPDPGAVGPDLTRVPARIRRDWFDRFLEAPSRFCPGTPMPAIFTRNKPALLSAVLEGDPKRQRDALWSYFSQGKNAPTPKPPPPIPIAAPSLGEGPLVAQIPIRMPDGNAVESLSLLYGSQDLLIYDIGQASPRTLLLGGRILRNVQGRKRQLLASGTPFGEGFAIDPAPRLIGPNGTRSLQTRDFLGFDRLPDGVRIRGRAKFSDAEIQLEEIVRIVAEDGTRRLVRELDFRGVPEGSVLEFRTQSPAASGVAVRASAGVADPFTSGRITTLVLTPDAAKTVQLSLRYDLPGAQPAPAWEGKSLADGGPIEGSLERPGYKAIAYPRPKTISGEDRVMPVALAVDPNDGRVFVASFKTGELFTLHDPSDQGTTARFENYGHGLFQDAFSMLAEKDALYVLHRRNLTRVEDRDRDGVADRFDRVAALPQGIADSYDYAYGLVRDPSGAFVFSHAPHANSHLSGSGGALRLEPGKTPKEIGFGFRNPIGWSTGPKGEVFFTDNQGEWVATNKLCHLVEGRYYGYLNPGQPQHATKTAGKTTIWVPYAWAHSLNGVTYDNTGGKFGPFPGQFFLAELMFGGAIIRADVEEVNGQYQGACFPFWGKGLLGPVSLAFDPKGRLYVGSITEPGWMAHPDRGALFRIDFTGQTPFEMQSIRVRPQGFRITFTRAVNPKSVTDFSSYRVEHYRYELTGAYGSPELDRTAVAIKEATLAEDGRTVDLTLNAPLVKDRVYYFTVAGARSAQGEPLVSPLGAYTLIETPTSR